MNIGRFIKRIFPAVLLIAVVAVMMLNFRTIFPTLSRRALDTSNTEKPVPKDIPNSLNFLNDDKAAFVRYCKGQYGEKMPFGVDSDSFIYFGSVDGARLYRMKPTLINCENISQTETFEGYSFYSDCRYFPSKTGLYIICNDNVFTLDEAYRDGMIYIEDVHNLYLRKMNELYPGFSSAVSEEMDNK